MKLSARKILVIELIAGLLFVLAALYFISTSFVAPAVETVSGTLISIQPAGAEDRDTRGDRYQISLEGSPSWYTVSKEDGEELAEALKPGDRVTLEYQQTSLREVQILRDDDAEPEVHYRADNPVNAMRNTAFSAVIGLYAGFAAICAISCVRRKKQRRR